MIDPQIVMKRGMRFTTLFEDGTPYSGAYDTGNQPDRTWRESCSLARPADDDKEAWSLFLPGAPLADTGPKVFKVGQVWAWRSHGSDDASIALITGVEIGGGPGKKRKILAGSDWWWPTSASAINACHSVLLFDAPAASNQPAIHQVSLEDQQRGYDAAMARLRAHEAEGKARAKLSAAPLPTTPRGKDLDCTAHSCDRLRELGKYANRAGLCTMHVAMLTGENGGLTGRHLSDRYSIDRQWAENIRREMRNRPEPTLIVGGLVSPLRRDEGWRKR